MIDDLRSVIWKEWKSALRWRGSRMRALLTLGMPLSVFGVYLPWEAGEAWLQRHPPSALAAFSIPILVAMLIVPDSFAGERERHTLATLLASRLSDRAILWGKVLFAVFISWGATLLVLLLGLVTWNVNHGGEGLRFYDPRIALFDAAFSLLLTLLAVGVGILISLRSGTVQEAQQTMTAALFLPPTIAGPILLLISRSRPGLVPELIGGSGADRALLLFGLLLTAGAAAALMTAATRFRRSRLLGAGI